jgi:hypothetical protein
METASALMDHDDLCMPERLSVQVAFLRAHPDVGLCGSDFSAFNEHGPIEPSHIATYYSQYARVQGSPAARTMCDGDWLVRVAHVTRIGHIHRALLDYRRSATQMSAPEQRPRGSIDAFHVARRIRRSDPKLMRRCGPALLEMLGRSATDVAYANAEADPFLALRCLGLAVFCYQVVNTTGLRALVRALLPNGALNLARRVKLAAARRA